MLDQSYLAVVRPIDSCKDLLYIIRKQIKDGRLEVTKGWSEELDNPTRELKCLVNMFATEAKAKLGEISIVDVDADNPVAVELDFEDYVYIFCIKKRDEGPAVWMERELPEMEVEGMNLVRGDSGVLSATGKRGGLYLMMRKRF
ncbi:MAG: hypothetical protein M1816_000581 [Peltula sp. TS41687]|nr:MAG: hypothetical protein M1816_000581 [Peltula sp. TS41687]